MPYAQTSELQAQRKRWYEKNKEGVKERARKHYADNRNKRLAELRRQYAENPDRFKVNSKEWKRLNPERVKLLAKRRGLKMYGLTLDTYEAMLDAQNGVCKICFRGNKDGRALAVDHNHATGKVRGLLCDRCNRGIGFLRDCAENLARAAAYLVANA